MAFDKERLTARFVQDAREHVARLGEGILLLEKRGGDAETLDAMFRAAHSLKGSSRMMGFTGISEIAHKIEDVFQSRRQGGGGDVGMASDLLLEGLDNVGILLDRLRAGERDPHAPPELFARMDMAAEGRPSGTCGESVMPPSPAAPSAPPPRNAGAAPGPRSPSPVPASPEPPKRGATPEKRPPSEAGVSGKRPVEPAGPSGEKPAPGTLPDGGGALRPAESPSAGGKGEKTGMPSFDSIRVNAHKLDELIKLLGEVGSGFIRLHKRLDDLRHVERQAKLHLEWIKATGEVPGSGPAIPEEGVDAVRRFTEDIHRCFVTMREDLGHHRLLHAELQEKAVRLRMLPLSILFATLPRAVRDATRLAGKKVELVIEGGDTEMDKEIIEKTGDPLMHMIHNAVVHGIEPPDLRRSMGKPETGVIRLAARYEGGNVLITVSDDGRGISLDKIRSKALSQNLMTARDLERAGENQIINLIFQPGFSTSDMITELSGRGMGMDVVRKNIVDELKGSLHVESVVGQGTTFYLRLPLTMTVIHALFVETRGMTFAIPAGFVREVFRVSLAQTIDVLGKKAIRLRDAIIPLVFLGDVLGMPPGTGNRGNELLVLITAVGKEALGLVVEELSREADVVIRPLPAHMKSARMVSGCAISGENRITNVLHIPRIVEVARDMEAPALVSTRDPDTGETAAPQSGKPIHILVIDDSASTREIEKSILESYGYTVTLASDGAEGLEKAAAFHYDLVITDVEMPRMDGFALTRRLKADERYRDTPVILLTSLDREEDKRRGMAAGASAYIVKGDFDQNDLLGTIRSLVG